MRTAASPRSIDCINDQMAAVYRAMTPAQRVSITASAHDTMRLLLRGRLMTDHPDWTESQTQAEIARRLLGEAV